MRHIKIQLFVGLLVLINLSCHNNRLKTDELKLTKEIQNQKYKTASTDKIKELHNNRSLLSFRKKEVRSSDPKSPPSQIDIFGSNNENSHVLKLSDFATTVKYIRLQAPPDTSLLFDPFINQGSMISSVSTDGKNIIFQGLYGITQFSMEGEYQSTIWKNKTGIKSYGSMVIYGGNDFFGVLPSTPVSFSAGCLYYPITDGPNSTNQIIKYNIDASNLRFQSSTEVPKPDQILGDTLLNVNLNQSEKFECIFGTGERTWTGINSKWVAGKSGSLLVTYNEKGDTLCQFTDYDKILNFSKTNYRHPIPLISYSFNSILTIKPEFNDTVFRVIPPNRLLPVYIISFGVNKVNFKDGLNPDYDLSEKYMIHSLFETKNYLFIQYTRNYDCPLNRKNKSVRFYISVFDKKKGILICQPDFSSSPKNILNDLDGGISFWPETITPSGEMIRLVSGKMIKDYVKSSEFKKSVISEDLKRKQISLASNIKSHDIIIIIVN